MGDDLELLEKGLVVILICLCTVFVNSLVLRVVTSSRRIREDLVTRAVASLAVADIGLGGVVSVISAIIAWIGKNRIPSWVFSIQGCAYYAFWISSCWHLTMISVIKCFIIVRPLTYFRTFNYTRVAVMIAAIWSASFGLSIIGYFTGTRWYFNWITILPVASSSFLVGVVIILTLFIPPIIMVISYVKILLVVRRHLRQIHNVTSEVGTTTLQRSFSEWNSTVRSAKNLFFICLGQFLTQVPPIIMSSVLQKSAWVAFFAQWIFNCSAIMNALLFVVLNLSVRREVKRCFVGKIRLFKVLTSEIRKVMMTTLLKVKRNGINNC